MKVGDEITFVPVSWVTGSMSELTLRYKVKGKVIYINNAHRFYVAEGEVYGHLIREAYKF